MKRLLMTLWRWFVSWNVGFITATIVFFLLDYQFFLSFISGTAAMVLTSFCMKWRSQRIHAGDLLKEEKDYIRTQLAEARKKWRRMRRARLKIRSMVMWQRISHISATVDKMIQAVERQPQKFRVAQSFFIQELDSAVTMIEKYAYLIHQPVRSEEMKEALRKTEKLLEELESSAEQQLLEILSDDVFDLKIEAKLLEQSLLEEQNKPKNTEWREEKKYETVR
ncbi:5-bromo-4-chloroindolyl phosphate hydrolysis family protein [Anoxybacillus sp. B7M1]|uniref:5-bromo-4-chloroindolyl phosphate hydrolysis family protein n=1 Tax=unclassified Anoxybacillus TaxID=2639704 RepID=UPI0005CD5493|nr:MULTISPECIES: 5-bromo-4-chloroindolyl phosphate hydrolysis family protein [unclassified Anoxybacillus]ANB56906.1 5-bromo-4-chloroindolyl phosphate hydrolysis family protein [Anoxybacillus sp. B2M1]ANB64311.1 5-bromo-4-chloroindolyl phosphate hydrolysis family protein [Anoxybacillus sp. B7M1]